MLNTFSDWLNKRNEAFGGTAGDPSNVGLNQPEDGERIITADPNRAIDKSDLPITARNRKNKLMFAKKSCNCK